MEDEQRRAWETLQGAGPKAAVGSRALTGPSSSNHRSNLMEVATALVNIPLCHILQRSLIH